MSRQLVDPRKLYSFVLPLHFVPFLFLSSFSRLVSYCTIFICISYRYNYSSLVLDFFLIILLFILVSLTRYSFFLNLRDILGSTRRFVLFLYFWYFFFFFNFSSLFHFAFMNNVIFRRKMIWWAKVSRSTHSNETF